MRTPFLYAGLLLLYGVFAGSFGIAGEATFKEEPLTIISDRLDAYDDTMVVVFSGNVVVTQKDIIMRSDSLHVYYSSSSNDTVMPEAQKHNPVQNGSVRKIEAEGFVTLQQGDKTVTGDRAVFYNADQKIEVSGNVIMKEGVNVIEGEKATFFISEHRGIVESSQSKRVKAIIYPEGEIRTP